MQHVLRRRSERRTGAREIFDALDAALDRALHLGLDSLRDRCEIKSRRCVHFGSPPSEADVWCAAAAVPGALPASAGARHLLSIDLISPICPSIDLQALGHADHLRPARQIQAEEVFLHEIAELLLRPRGSAAGLVHDLLNSGDAIALVANELKPFSISPTIFCHRATGSVLLSAIGVLQMSRASCALLLSPYHTFARPVNGKRMAMSHAGILCDGKPCDTIPARNAQGNTP